jgi:4a-hydroxytetrahydrobiopterin dehydratase
MSQLLVDTELKQALKRIPEWDTIDSTIERTFEFDDFVGAMDFVEQVADIAEEEDHHPDIDVRYNRVRLALSTHEEHGLTAQDIAVAERIDNLVE